MPKKIKFRNINNSNTSKFNINTNLGHSKTNSTINNVISSVSNLLQNELFKSINNEYQYSLSSTDTFYLNYIGIFNSNNLINPNNDIFKKINSIKNNIKNNISPIPNEYINSIYYDFILQYLNISPIQIGSIEKYNEINDFINDLINNNLVNSNNQTILFIYRDILNSIFKSRRCYIDNIAINNQLEFIKDKYNDLENLNINLFYELNKYAQNNGCASGKLRSLKPAIYIQAMFDINLAWYQYIYRNNEIDFELLGFIKNFVYSLGTKKEAYNILINLLNKSVIYSGNYNINLNIDSYKYNKNRISNICNDLSGNSFSDDGLSDYDLSYNRLSDNCLILNIEKQLYNDLGITSKNNIISLCGSSNICINNLKIDKNIDKNLI